MQETKTNWVYLLFEGLARVIREPLSPNELIESRREMEQIFHEHGLCWNRVGNTPSSDETSSEPQSGLEGDALPDSQAKPPLGHRQG